MLSSLLGYTDWLFRPFNFKTLELRVLLVGGSGSGKSTLLYQWKEGEFLDLQPRIMSGFEVEAFRYQRCFWSIWNITVGSDIIKPLLQLYAENTQAVLYVHDCDPRLDDSDDRIPHLHLWVSLMLDKGCRFLYIVPNKQDMLPPAKAPELALNLRKTYEKELARYEDQISWRILDLEISARTGEGVWKILDEVYHELSS